MLPEWAYGHWKSRDFYDYQHDAEADLDGYREHGLPLDAIVLDSPWETQYNTWEFNPHQFPDPEGMIARWRADGVRTVVWIAPWVNLESRDGQYPPDDGLAPSCTPRPRPTTSRRCSSRDGTGSRSSRAGGWARARRSTSPRRAPRSGGASRPSACWRSASTGIKADDGEGWYLPDDVRFADGTTGAQHAWGHGLRYRRSMQRALDEVHPGDGVLFGRPGWTGQQAVGMTWGGDQPSDFWSLRTLVSATLTAAASGFSNWSHDVGGYLGERLVSRAPKELLLRWVQFGCFSPLMHAHSRFEQEAWKYDEETLEVYRRYIVLHERLVPYIRAAAATAARCGLPITRPLALTDHHDARGWAIADAYGFGPSLWVALALARRRPRGRGRPPARRLDPGVGRGAGHGRRTVVAPAPLERTPVWVRRGALIVTYPAAHVARGLGDTPEHERPLEATLWGEPRVRPRRRPAGRRHGRALDARGVVGPPPARDDLPDDPRGRHDAVPVEPVALPRALAERRVGARQARIHERVLRRAGGVDGGRAQQLLDPRGVERQRRR